MQSYLYQCVPSSIRLSQVHLGGEQEEGELETKWQEHNIHTALTIYKALLRTLAYSVLTAS